MEFTEKKEITEKSMGYRFLGSKGQYRYDHPDNFVIFNSNVCVLDGKLWHGDLDISLQSDLLLKLSKSLNETVFVLYEMDGRFENESKPLIEKAPICFKPDGSILIAEKYKEFLEIKDGKVLNKPEPIPTEEQIAQRKKYLHEESLKYLEKDFKEATAIDWDYISKFSKKKNPLEKFWEFIEKENLKNESVSNYFVLKDDEKKLKTTLISWIKKNYKGITEYRAQSDASWALLDVGPNSFLGYPSWAQSGKIYKKIQDSK